MTLKFSPSSSIPKTLYRDLTPFRLMYLQYLLVTGHIYSPYSCALHTHRVIDFHLMISCISYRIFLALSIFVFDLSFSISAFDPLSSMLKSTFYLSWLTFDPAWVGGVARDFDAAIDFAMTMNAMTINAIADQLFDIGKSNKMNTRFPFEESFCAKRSDPEHLCSWKGV